MKIYKKLIIILLIFTLFIVSSNAQTNYSKFDDILTMSFNSISNQDINYASDSIGECQWDLERQGVYIGNSSLGEIYLCKVSTDYGAINYVDLLRFNDDLLFNNTYMYSENHTINSPDESIYLEVYFHNDISFRNASTISWLRNASDNAIPHNEYYMFMKRNTDECFYVGNQGSISGQANNYCLYNGVPNYPAQFGCISTSPTSNIAIGHQYFNFNQCNDADYQGNTYYKMAYYTSVGSGAGVGTYQVSTSNVTFRNISIQEFNNLPNVEFDIIGGNEFCYIDGGTQINLSINTTDIENDTIHYGIDSFNYVRTNFLYEESFDTRTSDGCKPNWDFFESNNYVSNYSTVKGAWEQSLFNLDPLNFDFHWITTEIRNNRCSGELVTYDNIDKFIIQPEEPYIYDVFIDYTVIFPDNNTKVDYEFFNSDNDMMFNLSINVSLEGISYFNFDGISTHIDKLLSGEEIVILPDINKSGDYISLQMIYINESGSVVDITIKKNTTIKDFAYLKIKTVDTEGDTVLSNKEWRMLQFDVIGTNFDIVPDFSTTKPESITFNNTGYFLIDLYISDAENQPNKFNNYSQYVSLLDNCALISTQESLNVGDETKQLFRGFKSLNALFIDLMNSLTGDMLNWKLIFNILFMIVNLIPSFIIYFITFRNVSLASITYWALIVFSHIFMYWENILSYVSVIMFVFSIASYLIFRTHGSQDGVTNG